MSPVMGTRPTSVVYTTASSYLWKSCNILFFIPLSLFGIVIGFGEEFFVPGKGGTIVLHECAFLFVMGKVGWRAG